MPTDDGPVGHGETILVVEDDALLAPLVRRSLERAGFKVTVAASGVEMMKVLYSIKPDLIVLDIELPDVNGRDLLVSLKKDYRTYGIPVVAWSGREADSTRRIALNLGAEDFVQKGPPSSLLTKIQEVLLRVSRRSLKPARD